MAQLYEMHSCDVQHHHKTRFLLLCGVNIVVTVGGLGVEDHHTGFHRVRDLARVIYFLQVGPKVTRTDGNQE